MASKGLRSIPSFVYGTAWKKDRSQDLVRQAINAGFRGVDTAAQPKHYTEDLVGAGIRDALQDTGLKREDLWIQTKFTPISGHDPKRVPYDPQDSIPDQIKASLASSFRNLRTSANPENDYLDALILHSPFPTHEQTVQAFETLAQYVPGKIRQLGISNVSLPALQALHQAVELPPTIVQNRFHAETGYDARLRDFCREKGIFYQSFWTLTANPHLLKGETVNKLAGEVGISREVALYSLVILGLDVRVLNGTTDSSRMTEDLEGLEQVRAWRRENRNTWMSLVSSFKGSLSRGRIL